MSAALEMLRRPFPADIPPQETGPADGPPQETGPADIPPQAVGYGAKAVRNSARREGSTAPAAENSAQATGRFAKFEGAALLKLLRGAGTAFPADSSDRWSHASDRWSHAALAGRVVELSAGQASGALTLAMGLVWEAQRQGEPVAWVLSGASVFYPPDAAANGVDLAALAVVRIPANDSARIPADDTARIPTHDTAPILETAGAPTRKPAREAARPATRAARAAERLARSGAFGLIVLDLGAGASIPVPLQGRLTQHAQRHGITILCLTEKAADAPSLGSLISLRGHARRRRNGGRPTAARTATGVKALTARFLCALAISKDKRHGPGWSHEEECHGPPGLR